jgi:DNA-binding NtrC family response regulator
MAALQPLPAPAPRHLLLVEDEPDVGDLVQRLIERLAKYWRVTQVRSFAEFLQAIAARRPDVVLLDLNLPDLQGTLTLKRALNAVPDTAIVVITGDETLRDEALADGAIGFVGKSALTSHPDGVVATIDKAYERQKRWQEATGP